MVTLIVVPFLLIPVTALPVPLVITSRAEPPSRLLIRLLSFAIDQALANCESSLSPALVNLIAKS